MATFMAALFEINIAECRILMSYYRAIFRHNSFIRLQPHLLKIQVGIFVQHVRIIPIILHIRGVQ